MYHNSHAYQALGDDEDRSEVGAHGAMLAYAVENPEPEVSVLLVHDEILIDAPTGVDYSKSVKEARAKVAAGFCLSPRQMGKSHAASGMVKAFRAAYGGSSTDKVWVNELKEKVDGKPRYAGVDWGRDDSWSVEIQNCADDRDPAED